MIKVYYRIFLRGEYCQIFTKKEKALRFIYMMIKKGYYISGWICDDWHDNEWLERRVKNLGL